MCKICGYSICPGGCPNAGPAKAVYECEYCGNEILVGDKYVDFGDKVLCQDCIVNELTPYEILSLCGYGYSVAEEPEPPDCGDEYGEDGW